MLEELENNLYEHILTRLVDYGHTFSPELEMEALSDGNELLHGEAVNIDMALTTQACTPSLAYLDDDSYHLPRLIDHSPISSPDMCVFPLQARVSNPIYCQARKLAFAMQSSTSRAGTLSALT